MRTLILALGLLSATAQAALPAYGSGNATTIDAACSTAVPTTQMPTGIVANDILIAVVISEAQAITINAANGFTKIGSTITNGTAGVNPGISMAVYWKRAVGSDTAPTFLDSGDHTCAIVFRFTGVKTTGLPWADSWAQQNDQNDTTGFFGQEDQQWGCYNNDCLSLVIAGNSADVTSGICGSQTDTTGGLTYTERFDDNSTIGLGSGLCLFTTTGSSTLVGAGTYTLVNTSSKAVMTIPLQGDPGLWETYTDAFNNSSLDTTNWQLTAQTNGTITETTSLNFTPTASTTPDLRYTSWIARDLRGSSFSLKITDTFSSTGPTEFFCLNERCGSDATECPSNRLCFTHAPSTNQWKSRKNISGVWTDIGSLFNAPTLPYWLRIRADSTNVYWESSPDGSTWTDRGNATIASLFPISTLRVFFTVESAAGSSPGIAKFNDLNILPSGAGPAVIQWGQRSWWGAFGAPSSPTPGAIFLNDDGTRSDTGGLSRTGLTGLSAGTFTMVGFGRSEDLAASQGFVVLNDNAAASEFYIGHRNTGVLEIFAPDGLNSGSTTYAADTWFAIGVVRDGNQITLYHKTIGGTLNNNIGTMTSTPTLQRLFIGRHVSGSGWYGQMAGLRIWSAVLTQTEVETEMDHITAQRRTDLWGEWYLDAVDADYLNDTSGTGNNLTQGSKAPSTAATAPAVLW